MVGLKAFLFTASISDHLGSGYYIFPSITDKQIKSLCTLLRIRYKLPEAMQDQLSMVAHHQSHRLTWLDQESIAVVVMTHGKKTLWVKYKLVHGEMWGDWYFVVNIHDVRKCEHIE